MSFNAPLPDLISSDWREALSVSGREGQGTASYQAPGQNQVYFVLKKTRLSGGQSVETNEYPFFGGWSNDALNEQPQKLTVEGKIQGTQVLTRRNVLIEQLRIPTSDDSPGFLVLPQWGRFSVTVVDWEISDEADKNGTIDLRITCTRSGISESERSIPDVAADMDSTLEKFADAAQSSFVNDLTEEKLSVNSLRAGCAAIAEKLLAVVGRIDAARSTLNDLTNSVNSITNLVEQGISSPAQFATAIYSSIASIVSGIAGLGTTVTDSLEILNNLWTATSRASDSAVRVTGYLLSAAGVRLEVDVATVKDHATKEAAENLYKTIALYGAAALIPTIENLTSDLARNYLDLLIDLENSINKTDPDLYAGITDLRISLVSELSKQNLAVKKTARVVLPVPGLVLADHLGISYDALVRLNPGIIDQFLISGEIAYV